MSRSGPFKAGGSGAEECWMIKRTVILGFAVLAGCSGAAVQSTQPSTILLPATEPTALGMSISDLEGKSINDGNTWHAEIVVTMVDSDQEPVAGVTVSGEWSEGEDASVSCTTDENGVCEFESDSIRKRVGDVVFEITGLEHNSLEHLPEFDAVDYAEGENPSITVRKS